MMSSRRVGRQIYVCLLFVKRCGTQGNIHLSLKEGHESQSTYRGAISEYQISKTVEPILLKAAVRLAAQAEDSTNCSLPASLGLTLQMFATGFRLLTKVAAQIPPTQE